MKVHEVCKQGFGLHQTFPPRFGWFKKAFDQAVAKETIFSDPDATVELGVGKNMVDAIAFWALAFRILKAEQSSKKLPASYSATEFGELLFSEDGLDPYLELPQSLWLLHWMAMRPGGRLPVWWLTFGVFGQYEFSSEELSEFIIGETSSGPWQYSNPKPISKDIDCLLRMYSPRMSKNRTALDDYLDSPFRDLGLIAPSSIDKGSYRFQVGTKPGLDDLLVLLACLDFIRLQGTTSLTVPRLVADFGSPGRVFKLNEPALSHSLNQVVSEIDGVILATPAGVPQLVVVGEILSVMHKVLAKMYPAWNGTVDLGKVFPLLSSQDDAAVRPLAKERASKTSKSAVEIIETLSARKDEAMASRDSNSIPTKKKSGIKKSNGETSAKNTPKTKQGTKK